MKHKSLQQDMVACLSVKFRSWKLHNTKCNNFCIAGFGFRQRKDKTRKAGFKMKQSYDWPRGVESFHPWCGRAAKLARACSPGWGQGPGARRGSSWRWCYYWLWWAGRGENCIRFVTCSPPLIQYTPILRESPPFRGTASMAAGTGFFFDHSFWDFVVGRLKVCQGREEVWTRVT
jgi:hypothetical protein